MNVTLVRLTTPDAATIADEAMLNAVRMAAHHTGALRRHVEHAKRVKRTLRDLERALEVMGEHNLMPSDPWPATAALKACDANVAASAASIKAHRAEVKRHLATAIALA